jgi:hypothetical protein
MTDPISLPLTPGSTIRITINIEVIPAKPEPTSGLKPTSLAEFLGQPEEPEKPPGLREPRRLATRLQPGEPWL